MPSRLGEFVEFLRSSQFRFYQERDLGLDLYHAGAPGVLLFVLSVAIAVVFLLSIFHAIPKRTHVVSLLLALGSLALLLGGLTSFLHFHHLAALEPRLIRASAGPAPATAGQRAAVIALPLVVGALAFAASLFGCLYMAAFWGTSLVAKRSRREGSERRAARS